MNQTAQQELQGCSNDLCRCTQMGPLAGDVFCSDYCQNQSTGGIESTACGCGHPACDTP